MTEKAGTDCTVLESLFNQLKPNIKLKPNCCNSVGVRCDNSRITDLNLSNSGATGPIPQNISLLNGLIVLDMSNNNLQGNIPTGLGNLFFLQVLRLNSNKLNGSIPSELSRLTKLENLQVQDNLLSGNVPDLSDLPLTSVGLHNNQLFGPLPDKWSQLQIRASQDCQFGESFNGTATYCCNLGSLCSNSQRPSHCGVTIACQSNLASSTQMSVGSIVLIAIGVVLGLIVILAVAFIYRRKKPTNPNVYQIQ